MSKQSSRNRILAFALIGALFGIGVSWNYIRDWLIDEGVTTNAQIISHGDNHPKGGYFLRYRYEYEGRSYDNSYNIQNPMTCFFQKEKCEGDSTKVKVSSRFPFLSKPLFVEWTIFVLTRAPTISGTMVRASIWKASKRWGWFPSRTITCQFGRRG